MKIGLRGGHSPFAKGAMGIIDEQKAVRELSLKLMPVLRKYGHVVIDCNSDARTVSAELRQGTDKANSNNCDIYITIHMNAFNGSARGVESLVFSRSSANAVAIGERVCANLASLGLPNRGIKIRPDLHDLRATRMQAVILELLFCDNAIDVGIWNRNIWDTFAYLIANAIDPKIPRSKPVPPPPPKPAPKPPVNPSNKTTYFRVICGSFKDRNNALRRMAELKKNGFNEVFIAYYAEKGFFRVVVGSFTNRANAEARIRAINAKGYRDTFIDIFTA